MKHNNIQLNLSFDEKENTFLFTYLRSNSSFFQVVLAPEEFESMANDMIKMIKDYNLMQIRKYQEKKQNESQLI